MKKKSSFLPCQKAQWTNIKAQRLSIYVVCKRKHPFWFMTLSLYPSSTALPWQRKLHHQLVISHDVIWFSDYLFRPAPSVPLPGDYASCRCEQALRREEWWHRIRDCQRLSLWERLWLPNDEHQRKPQLNVHMFPNFPNIPDIGKHPDA